MSNNDNCIKEFLHEAISEGLKKESEKPDPHGWRGGEFADGRNLQIDSRGDAGEHFVASVLRRMGKKVEHDSGTDPKKKHWDLIADGVKLEVKTATLGMSKPSFQHEGVEKDRGYDGIVFVDIAPDDVYISFMAKRDITWGRPHKRRYGKHYKIDFRLRKRRGGGFKDEVFIGASRSLGLPAKVVGRKMRTLGEFAADYNAMIERIAAG